MTIKRAPTIERTIDQDGQCVVLVSLANHPKPAKILEEDFDALRTAGLTEFWTFNDSSRGYSYVRAGHAKVRGGLVTIARLVLGAGRGQAVRYHDDDRLNLRRDNLFIAVDKGARHGPVVVINAAAGATEAPQRLTLRKTWRQPEGVERNAAK